MSSLEKITNDTQSLINERPIENARPHDMTARIEASVRQELERAHTNKIVFTDGNNHTEGLQNTVLRDPIEKLIKWNSKAAALTNSIRHAAQDNDEMKNETEYQNLEHQAEKDKAAAKDKFLRENNYLDSKSACEKTNERYTKMNKAQGGKPPVRTNYLIYSLVIIAVGLVEAFLNFETLDAKYAAPGIAAGGTILIALCFAFASHFHGGFLKQRIDLLGPDVESRKKRQVLYVQAVATLLVVIALSAVTLIRYQVIQDELSVFSGGEFSESLIPNSGEVAQTPMEILTPFILMNVAVWIVGIVISYMVHDATPSYQESYKDKQRARSKFTKLDNKLQNELNRIQASFDKQLEELLNSTNVERRNTERLYQLTEEISSGRNRIIKEASQILNRDIANYHNIFVTLAKANGHTDLQFGSDLADLDTYRQKNIKITHEALEQLAG